MWPAHAPVAFSANHTLSLTAQHNPQCTNSDATVYYYSRLPGTEGHRCLEQRSASTSLRCRDQLAGMDIVIALMVDGSTIVTGPLVSRRRLVGTAGLKFCCETHLFLSTPRSSDCGGG